MHGIWVAFFKNTVPKVENMAALVINNAQNVSRRLHHLITPTQQPAWVKIPLNRSKIKPRSGVQIVSVVNLQTDQRINTGQRTRGKHGFTGEHDNRGVRCFIPHQTHNPL
jgi:hypothetical protein